MKKEDLYSFSKGLNLTAFEHPRVTYAVNKNKRLVEQEIADMELSIAPDEQMKLFFKEREELAKKFSFKNEQGQPKMKKAPAANGKFQWLYDIEGQMDDTSAYSLELGILKGKFKDDIEKHDLKEKQYNEVFLKDNTEFKPFMLKLELIEAHEKCSQGIMDLIFWMIEE
jgi:hypothetical protein